MTRFIWRQNSSIRTIWEDPNTQLMNNTILVCQCSVNLADEGIPNIPGAHRSETLAVM